MLLNGNVQHGVQAVSVFASHFGGFKSWPKTCLFSYINKIAYSEKCFVIATAVVKALNKSGFIALYGVILSGNNWRPVQGVPCSVKNEGLYTSPMNLMQVI